jgi:hypothetical protein
MSRIDATFAAIPGPLLQDWGINATYIQAGDCDTYDPETGTLLSTEDAIPVRVLITQIKPEEFESTYQTTDVRMIIGNEELGTRIPSIRDRVEYIENNITRVARILKIKTYRGDNPIMHVLIVRPQ